MKKLALTFGLAAVASLALVACGGSSSSSTTTAPTTTAASGSGGGGGGSSSGGGGGGGASSSLSLAADPSQIAYDSTSLSAKAGNVTIDFNNPNSAIGHDVCVQDPNGKKLGCSKVVTGSKTTLDLSNLKAGSYTFYCSVDSHEAAGMKGTLTVQ
jgi:plastocyanin